MSQRYCLLMLSNREPRLTPSPIAVNSIRLLEPILPLSPVAHGGNPLGVSLSLWEKTALAHF
ncbi:hypothetical protein PN465_09630 [Nodularia spumigena CS-584]|uniref:hypothetical protein n=2 Tax=Nodularia spumigena TaxID=70799 RepID=UPI00232F1D12|nr:hypothetical protein [Nodularia spumigena]MDB9382481.1 hypothetical protein [Nodularia spumigena CS-584]